MNIFRKFWLAHEVKGALGGNVDAIKSVLAWVFKLNLIPSGYLTLAGGWLSLVFYLACVFHIPIPGMSCPDDPVAALVTGLVGIGLGRRKT